MKKIIIILLLVIGLLLVGCDIMMPNPNTPTPAPTGASTAVPITPEPTAVPTASPTPEVTLVPTATAVLPTVAPTSEVTAAPSDDLSGLSVIVPTLIDISHYMAGSYYKGGDGFRDAVDLTFVTSSSVLGDQAGNSYGPENLYDFDLDTVWCEGRTSLGIGEWALYRVQAFDYAPDAVITQIEIINGYIKTDDLFEDNASAKKILVTVDDVNWCILSLANVKEIQQFEVPDIELDPDDDVVIKFTILEVYDGEEYSDTCITAIEFGGTGIY